MEGQCLGCLYHLAPGTQNWTVHFGCLRARGESPGNPGLCPSMNKALDQVLHEVGVLGPMKLLGAAAPKHPCGVEPRLVKLERALRKPPPPPKSRSSAGTQERDPQVTAKCLSLFHFVCVGHRAKTVNTAHPGSSPWMALGIPPGRAPTSQLLSVPLVAPLFLHSGGWPIGPRRV